MPGILAGLVMLQPVCHKKRWPAETQEVRGAGINLTLVGVGDPDNL
jgi:hypothetical protein